MYHFDVRVWSVVAEQLQNYQINLWEREVQM
jgi:hypothetical protein